MYHRFNENKYPSTNIKIEVFSEQLKIIEKEEIKFIHPKDFEKKPFTEQKGKKNFAHNRRRIVIVLSKRLANIKRERNTIYSFCEYA